MLTTILFVIFIIITVLCPPAGAFIAGLTYVISYIFG